MICPVGHFKKQVIYLHLVPAPIKEPAVVLVVEGIAGDSENPLLESCEFMFELDLVHRTIVRFVNVSFHAVKILLETAKEWQVGFLNLKLGPRSVMEENAKAAMTNDDDDTIRTKEVKFEFSLLNCIKSAHFRERICPNVGIGI